MARRQTARQTPQVCGHMSGRHGIKDVAAVSTQAASSETPAPTVAPGGYVISSQFVDMDPRLQKQRESVRRLAEEVVNRHIDLHHRGLAICGVSFGVGVSFIASQLAVALSEMGLSVLLIDANLHRPDVQNLFRPPVPTLGLRDALADDSLRLQDVLHSDVLPNLSLIYAGADNAMKPQDLMAGDRLRQFLETALRDFDCTLVDTSPANQSSDARRVASIIGYALVVARRDRTFTEDITTFMRELGQDGVSVLGATLNAA